MREKKRQRAVGNTYSLKKPLTWRLSSGSKRGYDSDSDPSEASHPSPSSSNKRVKPNVERDEVLMNALNDEFSDMLSSDILRCIESNGNLEALKSEITSGTRLRKGTVIQAQQRINADATEIEKLLKRKRKEKTPLQRWKDFVENNFDDVVRKIRANIKGKGRSTEQIPNTDASKELNKNNKEPEVRTFSSSFTPLLRSDLTEEIRTQFSKSIQDATTSAMDYFYEYSLIMLKCIILFNSATFVTADDNTIDLQQRNGKLITDIIPSIHQDPSIPRRHVPPPLDRGLLRDETKSQQLQQLFNFNQLQLIHSMYFGPKGIKPESLRNSPFLHVILKKIPVPTTKNLTMDPYVMKMVLSTYSTNFKNMCENMGIFYSTLNRLLTVLLCVYLAPTKERLKQERRKKLKKKAVSSKKDTPSLEKEISIAHLSYNARKRLIKKEQKKQKKYAHKSASGDLEKWKRKEERSKERVATFINSLNSKALKVARCSSLERDLDFEIKADTCSATSKRVLEADDNRTQHSFGGNDIPNQRINRLKIGLKALLFKFPGSVLSEHQITTAMTDLKPDELGVCLKIANFVSPYIHDKSDMFSFGYRLPFMLMCNDIFKSTAYNKFIRKLLPLVKPSTVLSVKLDAPTIFSIMSSAKVAKPMDLYNFDQSVIVSRQIATESKDAIFGSFFDLKKLEDLCNNHSLIFAHNMLVLPGIKTVRINGYHKKLTSKPSSAKPAKNKGSTTSIAHRKQIQDKQMIKRAEIDGLGNVLKKLNEERLEFYLQLNIRDMKKRWIKMREDGNLSIEDIEHNTRVHTQIQKLKDRRNQIDRDIQETKGKLSKARQSLFEESVQEDSDLSGKDAYYVENSRLNLNSKKCIGITKVENCTIDPKLLASGKVTFSGTDIGLVSMTETVGLTLDKFKCHLKLYNRFASLDEDAQHFQESNFDDIKIPNTLQIYPRDVDYGSGAYTFRKSLRREKREARGANGLTINEIEAIMSNDSLLEMDSVKKIDEWEERMKHNSKDLRSFYFSSKRMKKKRTKEFKKRKHVDRLCQKERTFISPLKDQQKIMFVGDRGYGIGSTMKGFMRYGGHWKPRKHSQYATVCITNEHNTSQTCMLCFKKLAHPLRIVSDETSGKRKVKTMNGSFVCCNQSCPSVLGRESTHSRDSTSALAIAFSGACSLLLGIPCPVFNPKLKSINIDKFKQIATAFCTGNAARAHR